VQQVGVQREDERATAAQELVLVPGVVEQLVAEEFDVEQVGALVLSP
jgi:hypothetical protein